ncbi:MAG TPA: hypothetical protein VFX49_11065 [Chloroflexota bacterium]|nr:hypothetical protein [Chloroflexota bacterium]
MAAPYRMRSVLNDPSFAYGKVYGPAETLEKSITLLQTRLARQAPASLTMEYLDTQYEGLFKMLVDEGLCVVTAHTSPTISKDVWLRHQLSHIERYRE